MSTRCDTSDLPVEMCACPRHRGEPEPSTSDVDYRFAAGFESRLDCGHAVAEGDPIARLVDSSLVCERCM